MPPPPDQPPHYIYELGLQVARREQSLRGKASAAARKEPKGESAFSPARRAPVYHRKYGKSCQVPRYQELQRAAELVKTADRRHGAGPAGFALLRRASERFPNWRLSIVPAKGYVIYVRPTTALIARINQAPQCTSHELEEIYEHYGIWNSSQMSSQVWEVGFGLRENTEQVGQLADQFCCWSTPPV